MPIVMTILAALMWTACILSSYICCQFMPIGYGWIGATGGFFLPWFAIILFAVIMDG